MEGIGKAIRNHVECLGFLVSLAFVCSIHQTPISAQVHNVGATPGEHEETAGENGEHHHKNHIAVFVGATEGEELNGEKEDPDFTLGIDYERRLSSLFGFGGMADWVVEGNREYLLGPIGFLHPYRGAKLFAAPCYQRVREEGENNFVLRIGASWDFAIGKYTVGPEIIYDFAEEENFLVFGVGFGMGF